jgi:predicted outer membrane repeat protein
MKWWIPLTLVLLFTTSPSFAATHLVKPNGTGDFPTIQAAVEAAGHNDTILCAPGTYSWNGQGTGTEHGMVYILRGSSDMTIKSQAGPDVTILDGQSQGRIMFFQGETELTIDGFTFRRGEAPSTGSFTGAAFAAHLSSPIIKNCVFRENNSNAGGAYWYGGFGAPELLNCLFEDNTASTGGAVYFINSPLNAKVISCVFKNNSATGAGGAIYAYNFGATIRECSFYLNTAGSDGGAIRLSNSNPFTIRRTTIHGNEAPLGSSISILGSPPVTIEHVIMSMGQVGPAVHIDAVSTITLRCSDIFGHEGGDWTGLIAGLLGVDGNISEDPLFCQASVGDFGLAANSPCANANQPPGSSCQRMGSHNIECGSVPTEMRTWGSIKSLYSD